MTTADHMSPMNNVSIERVNVLYEKFNGWNEEFFDNFGYFIVSVLDGRADPVEVAFIKAGMLWEMFKGRWQFFLPAWEDVYAMLDDDNPPFISVYEWAEHDEDRIHHKWTISDDGPEVVKRFIREIVKES